MYFGFSDFAKKKKENPNITIDNVRIKVRIIYIGISCIHVIAATIKQKYTQPIPSLTYNTDKEDEL